MCSWACRCRPPAAAAPGPSMPRPRGASAARAQAWHQAAHPVPSMSAAGTSTSLTPQQRPARPLGSLWPASGLATLGCLGSQLAAGHVTLRGPPPPSPRQPGAGAGPASGPCAWPSFFALPAPPGPGFASSTSFAAHASIWRLFYQVLRSSGAPTHLLASSSGQAGPGAPLRGHAGPSAPAAPRVCSFPWAGTG